MPPRPLGAAAAREKPGALQEVARLALMNVDVGETIGQVPLVRGGLTIGLPRGDVGLESAELFG